MKDPRPAIDDMRRALLRIEEIAVRGRAAFFADWVLQDAAIRNFEIVGEAVRRVPDEVRAAHPDVPWADLAGFRDVLIHQYFRVDLAIVWPLMETRAAALRADLERVLEALGGSGPAS